MFSKDCIWSRSRFVEQGVYFQSAGFPICVTTVLGCSPCISLCPAVPTPLSGLNTYLGKYWAANHMPCSLSAPKTPITHRLFFFTTFTEPGRGNWTSFFFFFVSAGPNQSLFIQVNHALMHECSLSDSPCEPHSGHSHPRSAAEWELLRVISFAQGQVTRLHIYDYRPRFDSWLWKQTRHKRSRKKAQMRLHTENHSSEAGPEFNRHLRARCKDQWFHNHFHCPLVKLLLCTLKSPTVLSTQIIPGRDGSCYFLVWRSEWQMDSSE